LNVTDSRRWRSRAIGLLQGRPAVAVIGRYREPTAAHDQHDERIHAWSLREKKPNWWKPGGLKPLAKPNAHIFVCVEMDEIAGRAASAAVSGVLRAELASRPQCALVTGPANRGLAAVFPTPRSLRSPRHARRRSHCLDLNQGAEAMAILERRWRFARKRSPSAIRKVLGVQP